MAFATAADVKTALGRDLTTTETARAAGLLDEASDLVDTYLGWDGDEPTPIPGKATRVVARMVARVIKQESEATGAVVLGAEQMSRTMGPFTEQATFAAGATTGSPWLSSTDKATLRRMRVGGGLSSLSLATSQTGLYRTEP